MLINMPNKWVIRTLTISLWLIIILLPYYKGVGTCERCNYTQTNLYPFLFEAKQSVAVHQQRARGLSLRRRRTHTGRGRRRGGRKGGSGVYATSSDPRAPLHRSRQTTASRPGRPRPRPGRQVPVSFSFFSRPAAVPPRAPCSPYYTIMLP